MTGRKEYEDIVNALKNVTNNDAEKRFKAEQFLINLSPLSITLYVSIYFNEDDLSVRQMALQRIINFLRPRSHANYQEILFGYNNNKALLSDNIKNTAKNAIQHTNIVIRNLASQLYSIVICIEKDEMIPTMNQFIQFLNSDQFDQFIKTSFINVFIEVLNLNNFSKDLTKTEFMECYLSVFNYCQANIISSEDNNLLLDTRIAACIFVKTLLKNCHEIISEESGKLLLASLQFSLKTRNCIISKLAFKIMLLMIKQFYSYYDKFISIVWEIIIGCLNDIGFNNDFLHVFLNFWCKLADFEYANQSRSTPLQSICANSFIELYKIFDIILQPGGEILQPIDPDREDFDDYLISPVYEQTIDTIGKFAMVHSYNVFMVIQEKIMFIMNKPDSINDIDSVFFVLVLLLSITEPSMSREHFISYLKQFWLSFILPKASLGNPSIIRIVSLLLMIKAFEFFPEIVIDNLPKDQIDIILNFIEVCDDRFNPPKQVNDQIIYLYAVILDRLSKVWKDRLYDSFLYNVTINTQIQEKLEMLFNYGIQKYNFKIIRATSDAISHFIINTYKRDINDDIMRNWYKQTLEKIIEANKYDMNLQYFTQKELCSIISSFSQKINNVDLTGRAYSILIVLLNIKNNVFDDAALALHHIISQNPDKIENKEAFDILNICIGALHSDDPATVKSSCILISTIINQLYFIVHPDILKVLDNLLGLVEAKCKETDFATNVEKYIFSAIGAVLEAPTIASKLSFDMSFISNAKNYNRPIFDCIRYLIQRPIYYHDKNYENRNDFYVGICKAYKGYCVAYMLKVDVQNEIKFLNSGFNVYQEDFYKIETDQILTLEKIGSKILEMIQYNQPIFDETLIAFLDATYLAMTRCSQKNNMKFISKVFTKLFKICSNRSKQVRDKAKNLSLMTNKY